MAWNHRTRPACTQPDCDKPNAARDLCATHYKRWQRHGDPTHGPAVRCAFPGCPRPHKAKGFCQAHYGRWRYHGTPDGGRTPGQPFAHATGYLALYDPDHPLAMTHGVVFVHRKVLYDEVGPGQHPCRWCHRQLTWLLPLTDPANLTVDHLDSDKLNNDPANLVASCLPCNARRARLRKLGRLPQTPALPGGSWTSRLTRWQDHHLGPPRPDEAQAHLGVVVVRPQARRNPTHQATVPRDQTQR